MAVSSQVGYAVIGLGGFAERVILPAFQHSKHAKLVAVVSGDERKARRVAAKFGARDYYTYEDYSLCLAHPQVEAVYIATHNAGHTDFTLRAAAASRHVLCEKPMANTVEECHQMIEACRVHQVRLMIAYRKYFDPASLALKKLVASGRLGRLRFLHSAFTFFLSKEAGTRNWHLDRKLAGGGALVDVGVYCVNTARWVLGEEPIEASGHAWSADPERFREVEESIAFRLTFPRGLVMQATASFGAAQASFLNIYGEKGWAALDPAFAFDEERRLFGKVGGRWFEQRFKVLDEVALELDAFAQCIRRQREPEPNGTVGLRDVAVMQAIYRAAREGRAVPVTFP